MHFTVKAHRLLDGVSMLRLQALTRDDAKSQVEAQGYRVISIELRSYWRFSPRQNRRIDLAVFSHELLSLLDAGLSLVETIELLGRKASNSDSHSLFLSLSQSLREGFSFSRALESLPEVFPPLYIATVRTSEQTGDLATALKRYLDYHEQLNRVRDRVVSASIYPALLLTVGALVVCFLLGYVVPRFSLVYADMGGNNLPWMSQILMKWGNFVERYSWRIALASFSALMAIAFMLTRPVTRATLSRFVWSVPAFGEKLRMYQLARFTRTLAMLLRGGISFVTALDMVGDMLRQPALRAGLVSAAKSIREGRSVSDAFANNGLANEVGVRLLVVGERSGDLAQAMERTASLYDEETARWMNWFVKLFEPLLMIIIGIVIGGIVVLMYLPIFELANSVQ